MIDGDTISIGKSADIRGDCNKICAVLKVARKDVCIPFIVSSFEPDPKSNICMDPAHHGDFSSAIHVKSMGLRDNFKVVAQDILDYSRAKNRGRKPGGKDFR